MNTRRLAARGGGVATVSIHVHDLSQMFNSLDPSPFWDRDLDRSAAQFIEEEFSEKRTAGSWHLHVHAAEGEAKGTDLQAAIERYYERCASASRHELHEHLRLGEFALLGGIAIFLLCMSMRGLLQGVLPGVPRVLDEGLIILAWLALWRPADALVYEWIPIVRKRRLYERLAGIRVNVRSQQQRSRSPTLHAGREAS